MASLYKNDTINDEIDLDKEKIQKIKMTDVVHHIILCGLTHPVIRCDVLPCWLNKEQLV